MNRKSLSFFLPLLLFTWICARSQPPVPEGRKIYESKCAKCHGENGTRGLLGAKNLQISKLNDNDLYTIISEGKRKMPSWKKKLTTEQIHLVITYIKSLRTAYDQ